MIGMYRYVPVYRPNIYHIQHLSPQWSMSAWVILNTYRPISSRVCATWHIRDPVSLIEKSTHASCPGGRFPPSFIHQVIITGLNKL